MLSEAKLKPVRIFPELYDISDFLNQDHPTLHPESESYLEYWTEQIEYCIHGKWGHDYDEERKLGGWRWIPPNLYFYINMGKITLEDPEKGEIDAPPQLRDIDWCIYTGLTCCEGFSGFEDDEEYSCHRILKKIESEEELTNREQIILDTRDLGIKNKKGEYKKYIKAQDYLKKTFDKPLGKPLYKNEKLNFMILSTRGCGKSFSTAGEIAHEFTFAGAKSLEDFFEEINESSIIVGSSVVEKSDELLQKFSVIYENLRTNIGAFMDSDYEEQGILWKPYSGSLASNKNFTRRVKLRGGKGYTGANVSIMHRNFSMGLGGVGSRTRRLIVEEVGLVDNILKVHSLNSASQKRETKFGFAVYIGTGGDFNRIQGAQDLFTNPEAYDILPYEDVFTGSGKSIGLFIPGYYQSNLYRDAQGNTDIEKAFEDQLKVRQQKRESSIRSYSGYILNYPIVPSEMFMSQEGNPFDLVRIEDRLNALKTGLWKKRARIGKITYLDDKRKQARFYIDHEGQLNPINEYRKLEEHESKEGAVVIYEPPEPDKPPINASNPLYITLYDPVMNDGKGTSLAVVTVFKKSVGYDEDKIHFNIVAEWVGRKKRIDDNHEMAFKLATLYGSRLLAETNLKDIKRYARMTNRLFQMNPTPHLALGDLGINQKVKTDVGVRVDTGMNIILEEYLAELTETEIYKKEIYNVETGEIDVDVKTFIDNCWSIRFLSECKFYNRDDNFDYVSAMKILSLWLREQELKPIERHNKDKKSNKIQSLFNAVKKDLQKSNKNPAFNW